MTIYEVSGPTRSQSVMDSGIALVEYDGKDRWARIQGSLDVVSFLDGNTYVSTSSVLVIRWLQIGESVTITRSE